MIYKIWRNFIFFVSGRFERLLKNMRSFELVKGPNAVWKKKEFSTVGLTQSAKEKTTTCPYVLYYVLYLYFDRLSIVWKVICACFILALHCGAGQGGWLKALRKVVGSILAYRVLACHACDLNFFGTHWQGSSYSFVIQETGYPKREGILGISWGSLGRPWGYVGGLWEAPGRSWGSLRILRSDLGRWSRLFSKISTHRLFTHRFLV